MVKENMKNTKGLEPDSVSALAPVGGSSLFPANSAYLGTWLFFADDEIEAAMRVLRSGKVNYWTGQEGRLFEEEFAAFVGCKHATALANGTVALECALKALGIGTGDEVITTSRTFI